MAKLKQFQSVMMVILFFYIFIQSESPPSSNTNALAIYILFSLSFVVSALTECTAVILLMRTLGTTTTDKGNKIESQGDNNKDEEINNNVRRPWFRNIMVPNCLQSTNGIDFVAFWVYFFLFLLFNCIYWVQY